MHSFYSFVPNSNSFSLLFLFPHLSITYFSCLTLSYIFPFIPPWYQSCRQPSFTHYLSPSHLGPGSLMQMKYRLQASISPQQHASTYQHIFQTPSNHLSYHSLFHHLPSFCNQWHLSVSEPSSASHPLWTSPFWSQFNFQLIASGV